jgi:hypothetical protein
MERPKCHHPRTFQPGGPLNDGDGDPTGQLCSGPGPPGPTDHGRTRPGPCPSLGGGLTCTRAGPRRSGQGIGQVPATGRPPLVPDTRATPWVPSSCHLACTDVIGTPGPTTSNVAETETEPMSTAPDTETPGISWSRESVRRLPPLEGTTVPPWSPTSGIAPIPRARATASPAVAAAAAAVRRPSGALVPL